MFIISNDFRKGDSNKSIIKVYLLKDTSTLICKRSFKNVQELKLNLGPDCVPSIVHAM